MACQAVGARDFARAQLTDGTMLTAPLPYDMPYTSLIGKLFKIRDGKIHRIEAVLLPVPYGMNSGWSSWEEGMSSRARS